VKGYNVWVEAEDFHTEPWWEELVQAGWDGRVIWRIEGQGYGDGGL
jgi:hypothetical protein